MSHFFRALEQAERDRALREQQRRTAAPPGKAPAAPDTTMRSPAPPPASTAVSDVEPPSAAAVTAPPAPARVERERAVPPPRVAELRRRRDTALDVEPSRPEDEREVNPEIDPHLVSLLAPASLAAEHYRVLAHVVEQRRRLDDVVVVAVTSPAAGDGKSVTAANLAGALAHQPGGRVLLVEMDLREPSLSARLGLDGARATLSRGLVDPALQLADLVVRATPFNLDVVVAGSAVSTPYELLKSPRLAGLLADARAQYDHVIVDTPPAIPFPDSRAIARLVDRFLVVVSAHHTPRKLLEDALGVLEPAAVLGIVFNGDDEPASGYYAPMELGSGRPRARRLRRYIGGRLLGAAASRSESR